MEPISLIITALVAGATASAKDIAGTAVKDSYDGLKTLIKRKFEGDPFGQGLMDGKPEEIKQVEGLLKDKIKDAGVDQDQEIIKVAQELLKETNPDESAIGKFNVEFKGKTQGVVIGDHNIQHNQYDNVDGKSK
ncbi:MAG TPA: hypothetical protein DCF68_16605 [Cyanothece sp. UBA12306]|nr:hypothetical protein [Cyanothece sp. UBA12306]